MKLWKYLRLDLHRQWLLCSNYKKNKEFPALWNVLFALFSPRFLPVFLCRLAYYFHTIRLDPLAKIVSWLNFFLFGIEISMRCEIGPGIFFPHTQGTVIGAWSLGKNVTVFQGVTLGAREIDFTYDKKLRPVIGDDVMIGAGAKVLGGICIGSWVKVGANAVVLSSCPDNSVLVGVPARMVLKKT